MLMEDKLIEAGENVMSIEYVVSSLSTHILLCYLAITAVDAVFRMHFGYLDLCTVYTGCVALVF